MRWAEIITEVVFKTTKQYGIQQIFVSKQFMKSFDSFKLMDKDLEKDLNEFLFKKISGTTLSKEAPLYGPLVGLYHYHLRHGRVIIIYASDNEHIEIYAIGGHEYDGDNAQRQLRKSIKGMTQDSFEVWHLPTNKIEFAKQQLSVVENLLYSLVDEVDILKEYLSTENGIIVDLITQELNISNKTEFKEFLLTWEKQYKISFDKFIKRLIPANTN
jgi:mRNA-degrading endonuclease YafQ of YafQ-DinJ toxin-antitoxin module